MALSFVLGLADQMSPAAKASASAVSQLSGKLKSAQADLSSFQKQLALSKSTGDVEGYRKYSAAVDAQKKAVFGLGEQFQAAGGQAGLLADQMKGAGDAGGGLLDALGPIAPAAKLIAAAVLAVAAAVVALVIKGAMLAIEMGELKAKLTATFDALANGKQTGAATIAMLDKLGAVTGQTRAELAPLAQTLMAMGITGAALEKQLIALSSVKALGIDGGPEEYLAILKKISGSAKVSSKDLANLYKTGVNVNDIAKKMGLSVKQLQDGLKNGSIDAKKFGAALTDAVTEKGKKPLEKMAQSLTSQWARFKENIGKLFEDVDAGPFLDGLKSVLELFDQSTASGKTFKLLITSAFNAIFSVASKVFPYVKAFILGLAIGALKLYIALQPAIAKLGELFAGGPDPKTLETITKIGEALVYITVATVAFIATGIGTFIASIVGPFLLMKAAADLVADGLIYIVNWVKSTAVALAGLATEATSAAANFISGLVGGIQSGTGMVIDAVKALGIGAMTALKGILGIHSPSKEMAKFGKFTAMGFAQGIDVGAPAANDSMADLVGVPQGADGGGARRGGAGGPAITINLGGVTIHGTPDSAAALVELLEPAFEQLGERLMLRVAS